MLGKLMKYEIKATQRTFLPLYALVLAFAVLIRVFMVLNMQHAQGVAIIPFVITIMIYCVLIAAVFVMTLVVTIQRFNKNLLGDEGYLSFTLPVKVHSHITSKMIVSLMWTILSLIVAFGSSVILVNDKSVVVQMREFWDQVRQFFCGKYGFWGGLISVETILTMIVGLLVCILHLYASVTVGNLSSKHKLLAGFGAFIGFFIIELIVTSLLINLGINVSTQEAFQLFWNRIDELGKYRSAAGAIGVGLVYESLFGLAFYFLTNWLLSDKLNLE